MQFFNIEEKVQGTVLLPQKTSLGASAASLCRELPDLPGAGAASQCPRCQTWLKASNLDLQQ